MRRTLKWGLVALGAPILLIQFARPERANPPFDRAASIEAHVSVPSNVEAILDRSCKDCHSFETRWPWYSNVAPVSWLMAEDVTDGRRQINFSEWGHYTPDEANARLVYIAFATRNGSMPKPNYLRMHPEARLSDADVETLSRWVAEQTK